MPGHRLGGDSAAQTDITAAIESGIGVEQFPVRPAPRHAQAVAVAHQRGEIDDADDEIVGVGANAPPGQHRVVAVVTVDPGEAMAVAVQLAQRRLFLQQPVEVPHTGLQAAMQGIVQQMPIQAAVAIPFPLLAELGAHEQQFFARLAEHEGVIGPQIGEFLPSIARHAAENRAFAVHHLVMAQRQHEIFVEGIQQSEGQIVVMIAPVDRVLAHVAERVVHPPHVPFVAEPQAAQMHRPRDHGPGGGLLGDGHRPRLLAVDHLVHAAQEVDGLEVLVAAIAVGDPVPRLPRVIEVQHRGHGIHPQPVDVIFLEPEQGVGIEVVEHLVPAIVEDGGVPVAVHSLAGVGMFIEMGAVEIRQAMAVGGKMAGHPVDDDADPLFMQALDEPTKIVRRAETAGGRIEPDGLISPGTAEGIFVDRHQFHMGKPHVADIGSQLLGQFPIGQRPVAVLGHAAPRAQMHFVDADRGIPRHGRLAPGHPLVVPPVIGGQVIDHRGGLRRQFSGKTVGVGLGRQQGPVSGQDLIFVQRPGTDPGNENLPISVAAAHRMDPAVPAVEVPHHRDPLGIGRPHRESDTRHPLHDLHMGAQPAIKMQMGAFAQQMQVEIAQQRRKAIGVIHRFAAAVIQAQRQTIGETLASRQRTGEQPLGPLPGQFGHRLAGGGVDDPDGDGMGLEHAHHQPVPGRVHTEKGKRIAMAGPDDRVHRRLRR